MTGVVSNDYRMDSLGTEVWYVGHFVQVLNGSLVYSSVQQSNKMLGVGLDITKVMSETWNHLFEMN